MADECKPVLYSADGFLARIVLNRPEKRNALNSSVIVALKTALLEAERNEEVRALTISGAGEDFCAGADLAALQTIANGTVAENLDDARSLMELFLLIRSLEIPVVALVRGRALAGGCGLATACDLVLASVTARFGYPEVKIGFVPAMVTAILKRNVTEKRAFALLTGGGEISAEQAKTFGLVNEVFADESFDSAVNDYLGKFERVSKTAVSLTKRLLYQVDGMFFSQALEAGVDTNVIARMTEDCRQGIKRFLK
jgi:methylglutaconyl-CoA hydratase